MNMQRLKAAEEAFLLHYPGGFEHPEMVKIGKKHQMPQRVQQAQAFFAPEAFSQPQLVAENMVKTITRSSMVSVFEKPKLRDWVKGMSHDERESYAYALKDMLHGDKEYGFNMMHSLLKPAQLAKWSLMTILPNYYAPMDEVFVKPTTVKGVIGFFELPDLIYKPDPSYAFYCRYREQILAMRDCVDPSLAINNAAFCGFLMMTVKGMV
ncbi:hypothetical protein ACSTD2_01065 [Vibrio vulnificus]|uniref:hypothetical protein n=2 Tax=Vibrio vulnificus TaxID=672 RepID=UPI0009B6F997|nr:hypothetical protein [Vibrio vulnificus]OQK36116.1 hypothetical protein XM74_c21216 [Vibrio vulnificus]POC23302.1 hypothetical protein CRN46_09110 [Vibrio vulnificus]